MDDLLARNRKWARERLQDDPTFFTRLSEQQAPRYLWIGCSDSRVPATEITGLDPGEMFVHRNIANLVIHTDINFLSVLEYAVEVLQVRHIIVCGHYDCGGVKAALGNKQFGLIDNWLRHIRDIRERYNAEFAGLANERARTDLLVELNVLTQTFNVARTPIVQNAWASGRELTVRGWVYRLHDGILHDLGYAVSAKEQIGEIYHIVEERGEVALAPTLGDIQ